MSLLSTTVPGTQSRLIDALGYETRFLAPQSQRGVRIHQTCVLRALRVGLNTLIPLAADLPKSKCIYLLPFNILELPLGTWLVSLSLKIRTRASISSSSTLRNKGGRPLRSHEPHVAANTNLKCMSTHIAGFARTRISAIEMPPLSLGRVSAFREMKLSSLASTRKLVH